MRNIAFMVLLCFACGCGRISQLSPQGRLGAALKELTNAPAGGTKRFYALREAAKESYEVGNLDDARKFASELLTLAPGFTNDWNYGNAIHDGNMVLGRIALREGRLDDAKHSLIESGKSPGSPQMNSFGPNMSLARDLLAKGERETVVQYFSECRVFWSMGHDQLDQWTKDAKAGSQPDFGANLLY